jgi:ubiquinone/menaquinone biosynthesis C-methylase UbiE
MTDKASIKAYELPERVASYDAGMDVMHPNRAKMIEVALEASPFDRQACFTALDLGVGTGYFTHAVLTRFPNCKVIAIDGAASMVEMAKVRLAAQVDQVDFKIGDFRQLERLLPTEEVADLVYSSYALHHLTPEEKFDVLRDALGYLKPGGRFLNVDLIVAGDPAIEAGIQSIRVQGIVRRVGGETGGSQTRYPREDSWTTPRRANKISHSHSVKICES